MPADRGQRISNAIDSLITHLVPVDPRASEEAAQERQDACFELITSLLDNPASPTISSDVNHANDLIKRKLIQSNPSQALRFSNLYSQLLSLPVLNQKWAILYLLYQLSDSPDPNEPLPLTPLRQPVQRGARARARQAEKEKEKEISKTSSPTVSQEEEAFNDAFAPGGLKRFPPEKAKKGPDAAQQDRPASPKKEMRDVSLKSTLLADNYTEINPPETVLLRDLPFTLQGLSSTTLPFSKETTLKLPPTLPAPIISLLHTLAEPSLLHRGLNNFVNSQAKDGLLGQSLRAGINKELRSYLSLVATLEGQVRRALSELDEAAPRGGIGKAGVTLKRCVVWTREATMGLRLMSLIAEESKSRKGGQLISLIHGFSSSHGDPIVGAFAERLLGSVTRPFYDILRHWIYDGELSDPYHEFFVKEQAASDEARKDLKERGLTSVWNSKYEVDEKMVPSIITSDFAQKVFLIGKSLNFIRHSCSDSQWVEEYSKNSSKELKYGDTATLEAWIDEAYKATMQRLIQLMSTKFHLFDHLQALKDYILLGQGDFIALLMESLAANLDRPAGAQYRHTLTAQLDHAIRGSNAQYDSPEVLKRLDARMLQLSHGDIGWDCFTLEYKIDAPVDVVVTEWGNRQYLKVFNFLWRIKRVEFALSSTWRKCMTGARGVLQTNDESVLQTWKSTRGVLAEMVHFVGQLQYYILFEVIESSWTELQKNIHKENCTLDDLITAHTKYLTSITRKGLLGARRRQYDDALREAAALGRDAKEVEDKNSYMVQLGELLKIMLAYRDSVNGLYSWSVQDFTRRQEMDAASMLRTPLQNHQSTPSGDIDDVFGGTGAVRSEFPALQERLRHLGSNFRTRLQILLGDLAYQPDVDMRFLGVSMNFNDVYQPVRRKSKAAAAVGKPRASRLAMPNIMDAKWIREWPLHLYQTPAPTRFLLSKRSGTQSQNQTPNPGGTSGPPQFRATPRFSSTPRAQQGPGAQFTTTTSHGLALKPRGPPARSTQDLIDSLQPEDSSPTSPRVDEALASEAIDINSSFVSDSPPNGELVDDEHGRSPKRRRISISPMPDCSLESANSDSRLLGENRPLNAVEVESEWDSDEYRSDHEGGAEDFIEGRDPAKSESRPKFNDAPRFKIVEQAEAAQQLSIPEALSPQRRGVKYMPGGLAAQLRDWIVKLKGSDEGGQGSEASISLVVDEIRQVPGFSLVSTAGQDGEPGPQVILAGEGRLTGLGRPKSLSPGSVVEISPPAWDVDLTTGITGTCDYTSSIV
ncbi:hypothetical protein GQ53DRAFT_805467 [Thozetella sp. PMI_491]|nr:hypothetical protein GQ53DRAFT_805467 [Thozetella sp. PMI_491]